MAVAYTPLVNSTELAAAECAKLDTLLCSDKQLNLWQQAFNFRCEFGWFISENALVAVCNQCEEKEADGVGCVDGIKQKTQEEKDTPFFGFCCFDISSAIEVSVGRGERFCFFRWYN